MTTNYEDLTLPELRRLLASTFTAAMESTEAAADRLAQIGDAAAHLVELERLLAAVFTPATEQEDEVDLLEAAGRMVRGKVQ